MRACGNIAQKFGVRNAPTTYLVQGSSNRELYNGPKSAGGLVSAAHAAMGRWKVDLISSVDPGVPIAVVNAATLDPVILQRPAPAASPRPRRCESAHESGKGALVPSSYPGVAVTTVEKEEDDDDDDSEATAWILQVSSRWPPSPSLLDRARLSAALGGSKVRVAYASPEPRLLAMLDAAVAATLERQQQEKAAEANAAGEAAMALASPRSPQQQQQPQRRAAAKRRAKSREDAVFVFPRVAPPPSSSSSSPRGQEEEDCLGAASVNANTSSSSELDGGQEVDPLKDQEGSGGGGGKLGLLEVAVESGGSSAAAVAKGGDTLSSTSPLAETDSSSGNPPSSSPGWQRAADGASGPSRQVYLSSQPLGTGGHSEGTAQQGKRRSGQDKEEEEGEARVRRGRGGGERACAAWVIDVHELYFRDQPSSTGSSIMGSFKRSQEVHASCDLSPPRTTPTNESTAAVVSDPSTFNEESSTTTTTTATATANSGDANTGCPWLRTCGPGSALANQITGRPNNHPAAYFFTRIAPPPSSPSPSPPAWAASNPQVRVSPAAPRTTHELDLLGTPTNGFHQNARRTTLMEAVLAWAATQDRATWPALTER